MSGPLEELDEVPTGLRERIEFERAKVASTAEEFGEASSIGNRLRARLRALDWVLDLLAASGTGERPAGLAAATAVAWLHSDPGRCNHVETGDMGCVPSCSNPQGEWIPLVPATPRPTPPDAGTGTPSDDRRVGWILEALASRYSMTARTGPWSEGFRDGLSAAMQYARRATPAAPSGTTEATTGDEP